MSDNVITWVSQVFIVIFFALLLDFMQKRVARRLMVRFERSANYWDDAIAWALGPPATLLIWMVGITLAANIIGTATHYALFSYAATVREVAVIYALAWFLLRLTRRVEQSLIERHTPEALDLTTVHALAKLVRISVFITATMVMLQTLGFSISGVLAFGGVGGLAVGFAAKDLLANFFGALMIYLDRPFSVGDWVRSPDKQIEGTVEHIGWRLTRIRTFDKRPLYVPNAVFANIAVENPSRMSNRRIYETIGVRYQDADKMQGIVTAVEAMLKAHPAIDQGQTLMVNFNAFAASSLDFFVYTFTRTTDWCEFHKIKQDVLLRIYAIITEQGAEIAFPTSTVQIQTDAGSRASELLALEEN